MLVLYLQPLFSLCKTHNNDSPLLPATIDFALLPRIRFKVAAQHQQLAPEQPEITSILCQHLEIQGQLLGRFTKLHSSCNTTSTTAKFRQL